MVVISRQNRITIPAQVMREAGLHPGDDLKVRSVGPGRIELIRTDELVEEVAGSFDGSVYPPGYLNELRTEWQ